MKQIKFRAWVGNEFLYCDVLQDDHHAIKKFWVAVSSAGIEPEQFTGLYDSTKWDDLPEADRLSWIELNAGKMGSNEWPGREIYEGDLVKANGRVVFSNPQVTKDSIREISRNQAGFVGVLPGDHCGVRYPSLASNWNNYTLWNVAGVDLTVIGHIHGNPAAKEKV